MDRLGTVQNGLSLIRKLQLVVDSCVGVLQRNDFLNFETTLTNEQLSDLTRFFFQTFPTAARDCNESRQLVSYLFRSSTYSLFGHIIVNAQIFAIQRPELPEMTTQVNFPTFLNVVTGTPGIGKSTCRYPFITLLMSSGVNNVTTIKKGEGAFVFSIVDDVKDTGKVKIKTKINGQSIDFDTPSYLYTYGVYYFEPPSQPKEDLKKEQPYNSITYRVDPKSPPSTASFLGQISVPSVEYFPYFIRLMMGTDTWKGEQQLILDEDVFITQASNIVSGSYIAEGSNFIVIKQEIMDGPHTVMDQKILVKGSKLSAKSNLFQNSANPDRFNDGADEIQNIGLVKTSRIVLGEEITEFDQIVEAGTFFEADSHVTLRDIDVPSHSFPQAETIGPDEYIDAGSIIKKGSRIIPGSTINYYSIQNNLKGTRWHVIDEFVSFLLIFPSLEISSTHSLNPDDFHVLFSSPKGSRWRTYEEIDKVRPRILIESVVPKYTPQEEAAFLNANPNQNGIKPTPKPMSDIQRGVELFSFIPRFVTLSSLSAGALARVSSDKKTGIPKSVKNLFSPQVSHKLIHFTCPQFDCTNWHTEFATDLAKRNILHVFGVQEKTSYVRFLQSVKDHSDHSQEKGAAFHTFVSDAIVQGFYIHQPKRALSGRPILKPSQNSVENVGIQLPPTLGETYVFLRGPSSIRSVELPDLKTISIKDDLKDLPQNAEYLFENCLQRSYITSEELTMGAQPHEPSHPTQTTSQQVDPERLKCFTFYLNPLGANNVGFDSILLFFQVYENEGQLTIDKLSVMFIQSTLNKKHDLCDSGPNLMYLWTSLLSKVYSLRLDQIYPYLFYVTRPHKGKCNYGKGNIWKMSYDPNVKSLETIKSSGRLMVNSVNPLSENHNPNHFRCYYCGLILEDLFVDHRCTHILTKQLKEPTEGSYEDTAWTITSSDVGVGMFDHPEPVEGVPLEELNTKFYFNLWDQSSNSGDIHSRDQKRVYELTLTYPKKGWLPNVNKGPRTFDMMDVTMIAVKQPMTRFAPPAAVEPHNPKSSVFTIHPTQPLPNFFSLVLPISKDLVNQSHDFELPRFKLLLTTIYDLDDPVKGRDGDDSNKETGGDDSNKETGGDDSNKETGGDDSNKETGGDDSNKETGGDDSNKETGGDDSNEETGGDDSNKETGGDDSNEETGGDDSNKETDEDDSDEETGGDDSDEESDGDDSDKYRPPDVSDPKSHLYATLQMVHLWIYGYQVRFSEEERQIIPGERVPPNPSFGDLELWEDESIPICPMHVPTSCFGILPVTVNQAMCFTQSEIRTLLLSPDHPQSPPTAQSMFKGYIENDKPLPHSEVIRLLKMKAAKTPLISADLALLYDRIPCLKEQTLNEYDLLLLISVVNGTRNHIWEILGNCCKYLDSPSLIPEDLSTLDHMELRLENGYSIAHERLKPFVDCLTNDDRPFIEFQKDSFDFKCLEDDALLSRWFRSLLIPWIMKDARVQAQQFIRNYRPFEPLQLHDRWLLIAGMMVHAPISKSDEATLESFLKTPFHDQSREDLFRLVEVYVDKSSDTNSTPDDQLRQNDSKSWEKTFDNIKKKGLIEPKELDYLRALFSKEVPERGKTEDLIKEIKTCSKSLLAQNTQSAQDTLIAQNTLFAQDTLIALVSGYPRLPDDLRCKIMPKPSALTKNERSELVTKIRTQGCPKTDIVSLENAVNHFESLTYQEKVKLEELIESTSTLSKEEKSTLKNLVLRTFALSSSTYLVWNCISSQLSATKENMTKMFQSFREREVLKGKSLQTILKEEMTIIRDSITEAHCLLFERLEGAHFSRKDFAGLLCCPNGGRSFSLPALGKLFPDPRHAKPPRIGHYEKDNNIHVLEQASGDDTPIGLRQRVLEEG
ncbi:hypothetical protein BLNAU_12875 [Blattamonas nauphoetae]|uniref:Uncharacterized protein n=1 Tax=Blattamonas nauphoetae TaxID=2049346 RepID=A0ABQ9XLD1_9EUKA|nr:hypothetical protein BLNAU_12875 [Blattamonas nauphoetae]